MSLSKRSYPTDPPISLPFFRGSFQLFNLCVRDIGVTLDTTFNPSVHCSVAANTVLTYLYLR